MDPKILTILLTLGRATLTVLGFFGLGHLIEPIELFLEQAPILYEMIGGVIGIALLFKPYFNKSANEVKGAQVRKIFEATPSALSADYTTSFFNFIPKKTA